MRQSLHHLVAKAPWSDEVLLDEVRNLVLPTMRKHGPVVAWIVDETGFSKKGKHLAEAVQYGLGSQLLDLGMAVRARFAARVQRVKIREASSRALDRDGPQHVPAITPLPQRCGPFGHQVHRLGAFRNMADFAVPVLFQKAIRGHPMLSHLPERILVIKR